MWAQHWHHLALKVFCHKCKKNVVCDTRFSHFDSPLMGKSHTVKWIYCVYVAERDESKQARAQYTAELHDLVVILEKLSFFHTSFPIFRGQYASVYLDLGLSLCMLQKRTVCCVLLFFFPLSHNTKTNRNVRTGAQSKLATSFVYLVSGAP